MDNTTIKENAADRYFQTVIKKSWTWERLTDAEKQRFNDLDFGYIKGTARQRVEILSHMYTAYLQGIGYSPTGWRE